MKIITKKLKAPELSENVFPVELSDETMITRREKLLAKMKKKAIDTAVIYADRSLPTVIFEIPNSSAISFVVTLPFILSFSAINSCLCF